MISKEYKKDLLLVAIGFALGLLATIFNHYIQEFLKPNSEVVFLSYEEPLTDKKLASNIGQNELIIGNLGKATAYNLNIFLDFASIIPPQELIVDARSNFKINQVTFTTNVPSFDKSPSKQEIRASVKNVFIDELKPGQVAIIKYKEIYSSVSLSAYNQYPAWQVVHKDGYGKNIHDDKNKIKALFDYGESQFPLIVQRPSGVIEKSSFRVDSIAPNMTKTPPQ